MYLCCLRQIINDPDLKPVQSKPLSPILIPIASIWDFNLRSYMQGHKVHNSDIVYICSNFRGKVKPSLLIENLINYKNEDKERCNMLLLMLVVSH